MTATAHLLHGFIGAGKTTFARRLAQQLGVRRFTNDEWMVERYGHSPPPDLFPGYLRQIEDLIWKEASAELQSGADVVLDGNFWTREGRDRARRLVRAANATPRFYAFSCPLAVMRERTLARSENPPPDSLWIDGPAFDKLRLQFEPMGNDEEFEVVDST